jgi:integrase
MAVDDLWYLRRKDAAGNRVPSKRHLRGKRWRVRWVDPESGRPRQELFERKADADRADANRHADISRGVYVDPAAGKVTVAAYAEQWRGQQLHRDSTAERTERAIRLHIVPRLGPLPMAGVKPSHIRGWVKDRSAVLAASTLHMIYSGTLVPMFGAAVLDRLIGASPCVGIRLPDVEDGQYYIATPEQVFALHDALGERYRPIPLVAAGCGWRGGEIFGLELDGIDFLRREIHVRHQLAVIAGRKPYLAPPKTKTSRRTNELPEMVGAALARHIERFAPVPVELDDDTDPRNPTRRAARLLFTLESGEPIHRASWSHIWRPAVRKAGLPEGFGLRDLRHYYATVLIFGGANVKTVQLAMGHTTPTITLNTYVGYWPDALDRTRSLVEAVLIRPSTVDVTSVGVQA